LCGKWHAPAPEKEIKMAFNYSNFYYKKHWLQRKGKTRHITDLNQEDALDFLKTRPKDQKFALKISFFATHAWQKHYPPYEPKNETKHLYYNNVTIPRPKTATEEAWKALPWFFDERNMGREQLRRRFEPDYFQDSIKNMYRMATETDLVVGNVIDELKRQGVYEKTLLIFTTDNGNLHGEHGLAEKWHPFEESIRVPLVIQDPRMPKTVRGTTNHDWTLNIDLAPTILGAAKVAKSVFMQGRDLAELYLAGPKQKKWRKEWFYEYNQGNPVTAQGHRSRGKFTVEASFALITHEWKYVVWPAHNYEQLFHRTVDPYEEWDLLNINMSSKSVQTTDELYLRLKERYVKLKKLAQSGVEV
jgi:arylsulfatase A-like enzyme